MADTSNPLSVIPSEQLTDMIPLSTAEDTLAGVQAAQLATQPATAPIDPTATPTPPDVQHHMGILGTVLDRVGTLLGGDETLQVRKDPQGNVTITREPSTMGEKWGRIAMAALGGATHGLAVGQGPGGVARAAAAGYDTGVQQQQQRQQEAEAQATAEQRRLQFNANNALLNQRVLMGTMAARQAGYSATAADTAAANANEEFLASNPNNIRLDEITDISQLPELKRRFADVIQQHAQGQIHTLTSYGSDGRPHITAYLVDRAWQNQKNADPVTVYEMKPGDNPGDPPKRVAKTIAPGSQSNGDIELFQQAQDEKFMRAMTDFQKNQNRQAVDQSTIQRNQAEATLATERAAHPERFRAAGRGGGEGAPSPVGAAATPQETGQFLAGLNPSDAATVRAIGEARMAPPNRFTKEGRRLMDLVNEAYPQYDSTQYPVYRRTREAFATGQEGRGLNFIGTARNHLARMEGNIDALHNVSVPFVGSLMNAARNRLTAGTNVALARFMDDQKAVTSEIARAYNGAAITQAERDHMMSLISTSDSPEVIRANIGEFRDLLAGKLESYRSQWDSAMPSGQRNPLIDRLLGNIPVAQPTPQPAAAPAQAAPPAAQPQQPTATYREGQVLVNPTTGARVQLRNNQWVPVQ